MSIAASGHATIAHAGADPDHPETLRVVYVKNGREYDDSARPPDPELGAGQPWRTYLER